MHKSVNDKSTFYWVLKCYLTVILLQPVFCTTLYSQPSKSTFKNYKLKEVPGNKYEKILVTREGPILVSSSEFSFAIITGSNLGMITFGLDNQDYGIKNLKSIFTGAPIKTLTESTEGNLFFSTAENQITYLKSNLSGTCDIPPFYFPIKGEPQKEINKLWFDNENNLYIGVTDGAFYIVPGCGNNASLDTTRYKIGRTNDSSMVILKGELSVKKITIAPGTSVYSFAQNRTSKTIIWLGTSNGLYSYNKVTGEINKVLASEGKLTITHIESLNNGDIWFSTLEKGMGVYHQPENKGGFFPYPKKAGGSNDLCSVRHFCIISPASFLVAIKDSVPAIFSTRNMSYKFIDDPSFALSKNSTTDIALDSIGNFYFIKGGLLYSANLADNPEWPGHNSPGIEYTPLIYGVTDFNKKEITNYLTKPELLKKLELKYNQNSLIIYITSNYVSQARKTRFAWTLNGDINSWVEMPVFNPDNDSSNSVELPDLKPGKYVFRVKMKIGESDWSRNESKMEIIITPPYWSTWWFWMIVIGTTSLIVYSIIRLRVRTVRREEKLKARHEKELIELEAKALRAQMNPHFVFNCLNSIKALMQENENEKGVTYLTTFSKLIRTLFNNADKREITLYDEIATCRLYLQLEAMRFDSRFTYSVQTDESIDLKSVMVPALIIQPFVENAIWHGIVPKGSGGYVSLSIKRDNKDVEIEIRDDGIGRETSQQNKSTSGLIHQSKGVNLTQSRLKLDNFLQQRQASIETIDLKDDDGRPTGTKIIIKIKEEV